MGTQKKVKDNHHFFEFLCLGIYSALLFLLLVLGILGESAVYDEKLHLEAGYAFLTKRDFRVEPVNPPLAREIVALPLIARYSLINDPVLFFPRMMVVIITIVFGLYLYWFAKKSFGKKVAFFSLFLFMFEPEILTHGHYATTDLILAFLLFVSITLYCLWRKKLTFGRFIILSITTGFALSAKTSALPFLLVPFISIFLLQKKGKYRDFMKRSYWKKKIFFFLFFIGLSGFFLWSTYFFTFEPLLGYRFDPNRAAAALAKKNTFVNLALTLPLPLGSYISSIKQVILYSYSPSFIKESFLYGQISESGFIYFFPLAFIIKTPLPLLIFFTISLIVFFKKNNLNLYFLISILTIFLISMASTLNLGIRYILPVYPFVILLSSQIVKLKSKSISVLIFFLAIWYITGTLSMVPHYISFFNELVRGSKNGYKYLVDSNLDWGQGLIDLKKYQDKYKIKNLQLGYFGSANPSAYGIRYERIMDKSLGDSKKIVPLGTSGKKTIAISASCWYFCGYYKNKYLKNREIKDIVGKSILIFR